MTAEDFYLHPGSRTYIPWTVPDVPEDATLEVTFDGGENWHTLERDGDTFKILARGPEFEDDATPASLLLTGTHLHTEIRVIDTPETLIEDAGLVHVARR